jgi:hypothetical protein
MGLIKEPIAVDFTIISTIWTEEEEKEFSKLIRKQKEQRNQPQVRPRRTFRIEHAHQAV